MSQSLLREKNIPWNSNIIADRVSNCVLKTITGSFYILDGKMNLRANTGKINWACGGFLMTECVFSEGCGVLKTYTTP